MHLLLSYILIAFIIPWVSQPCLRQINISGWNNTPVKALGQLLTESLRKKILLNILTPECSTEHHIFVVVLCIWDTPSNPSLVKTNAHCPLRKKKKALLIGKLLSWDKPWLNGWPFPMCTGYRCHDVTQAELPAQAEYQLHSSKE